MQTQQLNVHLNKIECKLVPRLAGTGFMYAMRVFRWSQKNDISTYVSLWKGFDSFTPEKRYQLSDLRVNNSWIW